ncbi:GNAT family N-acetyltransferase [Brevibacillus sp. SYSU BS000544]|uniref:GNAT family N-acetyltransferase n=1 Tax=Brevibacillus sp. SYSU BS000544 TaxID=3416443 RepID=UPI003CE57980
MSNNISKTIAYQKVHTETEAEQIYRLRYEIYVREFGWAYQADHELEQFHDEMDEWGHCFYAMRDTEMIATSRVNIGRAGDFSSYYRKILLLDKFQQYRPDEPILAVGTRYALRPTYRNTKVLLKMIEMVVELAVKDGAHFFLIASHERLVPLYQRLGWRKYAAPFDDGIAWQCPMVLVLDDVVYLREQKSFLLSALMQREADTEAVDWLLEQEMGVFALED